VFGFSVGSARIRATVEGKFAEATIVVEAVPVARVVVTPNALTLNPGQTSQLNVSTQDASGNVLVGRRVTYTSSDPAKATVSGSGLVTGITQGTARVDVTSEGVTTGVTVNVNPVPISSISITPNVVSLRATHTSTLMARALDAQGQPLPNRTFTWSSANTSIATVDQSGVVTGVAVGSTTVSASSEGKTGTASITVIPEPVNSVTLTSPRNGIVPGDTMHLTVVLRDAQNNVLTGRAVTFSSTPAGRVTVDAAGVVTGISSSGTSDITATSEGKSATIQITSVAAVASITAVGPTNSAVDLVIPPGSTKRYTVTLLDGGGNPVAGQVVSATSSSTAVTLSSGTLTTDAQGQATVDLTGNTAGSATVTFQASRVGAIPPATPGNNNPSTSLSIVVP
ncbi:MAG: Ig-like domain-containing protein, partial [Gemmatimonadota bacterium]